jgi:hypothetical protein
MDYVEEIDNGWLFNPDGLNQIGTQDPESGQTVPAKIYLKFQKNPNDPNKPLDNKYFWVSTDTDGDGIADSAPVAQPTLDSNGDGLVSPEERSNGSIRRPLDDDGNWQVVNGHILHIHIAEINRIDGIPVAPSEYSNYVTLVNNDGQPVDFIEVQTTSDGAAQVRVCGGLQIVEMKDVLLEAVDESIANE